MGDEAMPCNTSMVLINKGRPVLNMNKRICAVFKVCSTSCLVTVTGQGHGQEPPPVIMVDELLILSPHKLSFSEAGLRIMITPHFPPRTRLSMAGRMVISEVRNTHRRRHDTQQTVINTLFVAETEADREFQTPAGRRGRCRVKKGVDYQQPEGFLQSRKRRREAWDKRRGVRKQTRGRGEPARRRGRGVF